MVKPYFGVRIFSTMTRLCLLEDKSALMAMIFTTLSSFNVLIYCRQVYKLLLLSQQFCIISSTSNLDYQCLFLFFILTLLIIRFSISTLTIPIMSKCMIFDYNHLNNKYLHLHIQFIC